MDLSTCPIPQTYYCEGKKCYLDPIREKFVEATPEETVRQQVILYLIDKVKVPKRMLDVEVLLSKYGIPSSHRADIVIHSIDKCNLLRPIVVIECKAPSVILSEKELDQLFGYCDEIGSDYALLTNGLDCFNYHYDESKNRYQQIVGLPTYSELLSNQYVIIEETPPQKRVHFYEIPEILAENPDCYSGEVSLLTEKNLATAAVNLWEGLLDTSHQLPSMKNSLFELVEDIGVRIKTYGNASGGSFTGAYRSFLIRTGRIEQIVSFGLSTYTTYDRPDLIKTSLNVAIENSKISHHSLQLILDDNVERVGEKFIFCHHGRIAVGNLGSGKISELRKFVNHFKPDLIYDERFCFGSLVNDRDWNLDDPEVALFIEKLICYALIRDVYRSYIKNQR